MIVWVRSIVSFQEKNTTNINTSFQDLENLKLFLKSSRNGNPWMKKLKKKLNENMHKGLVPSSLRVVLVPSVKVRIKNLNPNQDQRDQKIKKRLRKLKRVHRLFQDRTKIYHLKKRIKRRRKKQVLNLGNTKRKNHLPKEIHLISKDLRAKMANHTIHPMIHQISRTDWKAREARLKKATRATSNSLSIITRDFQRNTQDGTQPRSPRLLSCCGRRDQNRQGREKERESQAGRLRRPWADGNSTES